MLAWGNVVSPAFRTKVSKISNNLGVEANYLMACMAFETGETFSASITNAAGSGAIGLIQFMPSTAQALGTNTISLGKMSSIQQLDYVELYFQPKSGKLRTLEDVYMAILWPAAVGKPSAYVLFSKTDPSHPKRYIQNSGLDFNRDGVITKAEAAAKVMKKLERGLLPEFSF